jgi:hypothetical protein
MIGGCSELSGGRSGDAGMVQVPNVTGETADLAEIDLEAAGLTASYHAVPRRKEICTVTEQDRNGNVEKGIKVNLTCVIDVPDVTGQPASDARSEIRDVGLRSTFDPQPDDPSWCTVSAQNPSREATPDEEITLTLACDGVISQRVPARAKPRRVSRRLRPRRGPSGAHGTYQCGDFSSQQQAQAFYDAQGGVAGGDPGELDSNHDGKACEWLP